MTSTTKEMLIYRNVAFIKHINPDGSGYVNRYIVPEETNRALQEGLRTGTFKEGILNFLAPGPNQKQDDPEAALLSPGDDETPIEIDIDGNITKDGVWYYQLSSWTGNLNACALLNTREMLFEKLKAAPIGSKEQQEALDALVAYDKECEKELDGADWSAIPDEEFLRLFNLRFPVVLPRGHRL